MGERVSEIVHCDGCGAMARRRVNRPCPDHWFYQCARGGVAFFLKQAVDDRGDGDERCPECGEQIRWYVHDPGDSSASCACTVEGAEDANFHPPIGIGDESKRKPGNVIELPYLDGVQHAAFPEVERTIHG